MTAVWPDQLPRPDRQGYQRSPQEARQQRSSDEGTAGWGRKYSNVAEDVSLVIQVTRNGKAIFENFYRDDTKRGAEPFFMPDPTTAGWALQMSGGAPLLLTGGMPILMGAQWLCMFSKQRWTETIVGVEFRIAFSVTVMP